MIPVIAMYGLGLYVLNQGDNLASSIWETLFKLANAAGEKVSESANAIVSQLFPDLSSLVTEIESITDTYIVPNVNYFFHLLPPRAMTLLTTYLTLLVVFYTITVLIHALIKLIEIIKNIKIW